MVNGKWCLYIGYRYRFLGAGDGNRGVWSYDTKSAPVDCLSESGDDSNIAVFYWAVQSIGDSKIVAFLGYLYIFFIVYFSFFYVPYLSFWFGCLWYNYPCGGGFWG